MTWFKLDAAAISHPKFLSVGPTGLWAWIALMSWASEHASDGFVPKCSAKVALSGLQRGRNAALRALVSCGLLSIKDDGFVLHDYLDHQRSREQVRLEKAANRKRQAARRGACHAVTEVDVTPLRAEPVTALRAEGVTGSQEIRGEYIEITTTPRVLARVTPAAAAAADAADAADPVGLCPCPPDLRLLPAQAATLEMHRGIPAWAIEHIAVDFVASALASPTDCRTIDTWRKCLSKAVAGRWSDPAQRPTKPAEPVVPPTVEQIRAQRIAERAAGDAERKRQYELGMAREVKASALREAMQAERDALAERQRKIKAGEPVGPIDPSYLAEVVRCRRILETHKL